MESILESVVIDAFAQIAHVVQLLCFVLRQVDVVVFFQLFFLYGCGRFLFEDDPQHFHELVLRLAIAEVQHDDVDEVVLRLIGMIPAMQVFLGHAVAVDGVSRLFGGVHADPDGVDFPDFVVFVAMEVAATL